MKPIYVEFAAYWTIFNVPTTIIAIEDVKEIYA